MARSLTLTTDDGVHLDADLAVPDGPATAAVVLCHPHPLHGGDRRAGVLTTLHDRLPALGLAVLRFDFRGVGASTGVHDGGRGEQLDVVAAADALAAEVDAPLVLAGWSFGADLALAVDHPAAVGWFAIAPVLGVVDPATMAAATDPRPALLVVPEHDQFTPPPVATARTATWPTTEVRPLPGTDHFLAGRHQEITDHLVRFAPPP